MVKKNLLCLCLDKDHNILDKDHNIIIWEKSFYEKRYLLQKMDVQA